MNEIGHYMEQVSRLSRELREARAEVERLRAALEEINNTDMYVAPMVRAIAARALNPEREVPNE